MYYRQKSCNQTECPGVFRAIGRRARGSGWLLTFGLVVEAVGADAPAPVPAPAPVSTALEAKPEPSLYDRIWKYAEWYHDEENPVIQSFRFTGRFQFDYAVLDASQGQHDEWNIRRFRLGAKTKWFKDFTLHGEVDLNPQEADPLYVKTTDLLISWSRSKELVATVGKQSAPFTLDGMTSSKELLAIDRSNLANNYWFPEEYIPGVSVAGKPGSWNYFLGGFTSGKADKEFGDFSGGFFVLSTVGYDFGGMLGVKEALVAANYVYNEPDANNTFTRNLEHVGSLSFRFDTGKWGVRTDLTEAAGYLGQSDGWGTMAMPFYNFTREFQGVLRYTYLRSDDPNGLRLARYENQVVPGRGDEYQEFYMGFNYYFYGHKLKLQTGVQYADMEDTARDGGRYTGWSWVTGVRIAW